MNHICPRWAVRLLESLDHSTIVDLQSDGDFYKVDLFPRRSSEFFYNWTLTVRRDSAVYKDVKTPVINPDIRMALVLHIYR